MRLWWGLVRLGFRLLYDELAWLYDTVAWLTSFGLWRRWTLTAAGFLPERGRVLEVAFGPGHLLAHLAGTGRDVVGLDLSRGMARLAARRLRRRRLAASLVRGRAQALPFAPATFDAVVLTFPTPFVYDPLWLVQARRVLCPGGRFVLVEQATFERAGLAGVLLDRAYAVTGQRGGLPDLPGRLQAAGFRARRESLRVGRTTVGLVVAEAIEPQAPAQP